MRVIYTTLFITTHTTKNLENLERKDFDRLMVIVNKQYPSRESRKEFIKKDDKNGNYVFI